MDGNDISFVSLGLVVLDEIRFPNQKPLTNILGGSGSYATLGARLFLPAPTSRRVAWRIHTGNDFPEPIKDLLHSWNITLSIHEEPERSSTRGLLEYHDTTFGPKNFRYTTPVLSVGESDLEGIDLLKTKVYHYLASPQDIKTRVSNLLALRHKAGISDRPLIIWEPAPLSCTPENLEGCLDAGRYVDVLSPNHLELSRLFSRTAQDAFTKTTFEELALKLVDNGVGPDSKGIVLIRAGEEGCLVQSRDLSPTWLPPFYGSDSKQHLVSKVVDPTGAGNTFLGGYAVGYLRTGDFRKAACYGTIAASIALEQISMPNRVEKGDAELWNGVSIEARLREYMSREDVEKFTRAKEKC